MRTTLRVDDELMRQLKSLARRENVSLSQLVNRVLRSGLQMGGARPRKRTRYRERVHSLGTPRVGLDKALAIAAAMEDEEIARELATRK